MNLHLEVEISEIFYLKPRGGKKKKNVAGKKNRKWKLKMQNDSGFSSSRKLECVLKLSLLIPQLGLRRRRKRELLAVAQDLRSS